MFIQNNIFTDFESTFSTSHIDIRLAQRNGKKCITSVEGLDNNHPKLKQKDLTVKKLLSIFKNKFACNGAVKEHDGRWIFTLFGNQNNNVKEYLISEGICDDSEITVHGAI